MVSLTPRCPVCGQIRVADTAHACYRPSVRLHAYRIDEGPWQLPDCPVSPERARWQVPYAAPEREYANYRGEIDEAILRVLSSGRYVGGPEVEAFEAEIAAYLGVGYVVAVKSGTDALRLVDEAFGDQPLPVRITHWDGYIGTLPDTPFIEDAAQAFGSRTNDGRLAGTLGLAAAFSLHPLKTLSVLGGGGFVATKDGLLAGRVRELRGHGLDAIQCAVGRVKLRHVDTMIARKHEIARRYASEMPRCVIYPDYDHPSNYPVHGLGVYLKLRGIETIPGNVAGMVNLPLHAEMTDAEVSVVIEAVNEYR